MVCRNCHRIIKDDAKVCVFCSERYDTDRKIPVSKRDDLVLRKFGSRTATDAGGKKGKIPPRPSPVKDGFTGCKARNTNIPKYRGADDFDDQLESDVDDLFEEDDEEEESFADAVRRKVQSFIAGTIVIALFAFAFWLLVLPSGAVFRAKINFYAPASAYERLGDELLASNQISAAADAYYNALRHDPSGADYTLALRVAQTQDMIGDTDRAISAYTMCIELDPVKTEPYEALADIYRARGDAERAQSILEYGAQMSGDESLQDY